jgi:hypothetical protein
LRLGLAVHREHRLVAKRHLIVFAEPVETIRHHAAVSADLTNTAETLPASRFVKVASGSAWYHEEAVQMAEPRPDKM